MRVLTVVILACLLAGCGGSLPPVDVIENVTCLAGHNYIAAADCPDGRHILEDHDGVLFSDVQGTFSGSMVGCVSMQSWDATSWQSARKQLGLDPLMCVVSVDGAQRLCPGTTP